MWHQRPDTHTLNAGIQALIDGNLFENKNFEANDEFQINLGYEEILHQQQTKQTIM